MMKASKKAVANNITKKAQDEQIKADYLKDMEKSKEEVLLISQKKMYLDWLIKTTKTNTFQFFVDMQKKLESGDILTTNMEIALVKCMARDKAKDEPVDESKCKKITLKMRQWWVRQHELGSRIITGVVLRETEKAYYIKGYADMVEGTYCMRCNRELTEPASMLIGFGAECCAKLGIAYPSDILTATKKERLAVRKSLLKVLNNQTFEAWVPKSQVEEEIK